MKMSSNRAERLIICIHMFGKIRLRIPPVANFGKHDIIRFRIQQGICIIAEIKQTVTAFKVTTILCPG